MMNIDPEYVMKVTPFLAAALFAALFAAERLRPLRHPSRPGFRRWSLNVLAMAIAFGVAAFTVAPAALRTMRWSEENGVGLLHAIPLPPWLAFVAGFLLMDLTFYYWHRLNHEVPLLWRFHNVHHIDPDLDTTTSFRFHYGEIAYSAGFRFVQIGIIGVSLHTFAIYQAVFICATIFHHSNLRLPLGLERALNLVIVTPRMHGIHHSVIRDETNSNYSVVFRWWDPLNRSLRLNVPQKDIEVGVAAYTREDDNSLGDLFWLPFRRQRKYWTDLEGRPSHTRDEISGGLRQLLLE